MPRCPLATLVMTLHFIPIAEFEHPAGEISPWCVVIDRDDDHLWSIAHRFTDGEWYGTDGLVRTPELIGVGLPQTPEELPSETNRPKRP